MLTLIYRPFSHLALSCQTVICAEIEAQNVVYLVQILGECYLNALVKYWDHAGLQYIGPRFRHRSRYTVQTWERSLGFYNLAWALCLLSLLPSGPKSVTVWSNWLNKHINKQMLADASTWEAVNLFPWRIHVTEGKVSWKWGLVYLDSFDHSPSNTGPRMIAHFANVRKVYWLFVATYH